MTSKLIQGMIDNLLHDQGKGFDRTVIKNLQKSDTLNLRVIAPNCLTSLFLLDRGLSPIDSYVAIMDKQNGYSNSTVKEQALVDAKKLGKKSQLPRFISAIENNEDGFGSKYGNELFVQALKHVENVIPNENFTVQLLSAISEAKMNAKDDADAKQLLKIEEQCKPIVYYTLNRAICPFRTQKQIQDQVMKYFATADNGKNLEKACDYFRCLGIANAILSKLSDTSVLNIDYNNTNKKNSSLSYVDVAGIQRFLINSSHPEAEQTEKITDIIKKCKLIDNGEITGQSKYIQKALQRINKKVVANYDSHDDKTNFLQTALTFLILMDEEEIEDPYDMIGSSIANPVSDILTLMQDNQDELKQLIMNSYRVANSIVKSETGKSIHDRYFKEITGDKGITVDEKPEDKPEEEIVEPVNENKPEEERVEPADENPATDNKPEDKDKKDGEEEKPNDNNDIVENKKPDDKKDNQDKPEGKKDVGTKKRSGTGIIGKKVSTDKKYVKTNVKFYETLTAKLVQTIAKDYEKFTALNEEKIANNGLKGSKKTQFGKLEQLYGSPSKMRELIKKLESMHSNMVFLRKGIEKAVRDNKEWTVSDDEKNQLFLTEEQDKNNATKFSIFEAFCTFLKNFDNSQKLTLAHMQELREKDPTNPLNKILVYLPKKRATAKKKEEQINNVVKADEKEEEEEETESGKD